MIWNSLYQELESKELHTNCFDFLLSHSITNRGQTLNASKKMTLDNTLISQALVKLLATQCDAILIKNYIMPVITP